MSEETRVERAIVADSLRIAAAHLEVATRAALRAAAGASDIEYDRGRDYMLRGPGEPIPDSAATYARVAERFGDMRVSLLKAVDSFSEGPAS